MCTDGQTDRPTTYHGITALRYAVRGKNNNNLYSPCGSKNRDSQGLFNMNKTNIRNLNICGLFIKTLYMRHL